MARRKGKAAETELQRLRSENAELRGGKVGRLRAENAQLRQDRAGLIAGLRANNEVRKGLVRKVAHLQHRLSLQRRSVLAVWWLELRAWCRRRKKRRSTQRAAHEPNGAA